MGLEISLSCGSVRLSSSRGMQWKGLLVERHVAHARPAEQSAVSQYLIELASGPAAAYGERAVRPGEFRHYSKTPGMLNLYTEGMRPALRPTTPTELTVCAIDPELVREVGAQTDRRTGAAPVQQFGFHDGAMAHLLGMLETEAREGNPAGMLYADHLIQALVLRMHALRGGTSPVSVTRWDLPRRRLGRVIDLLRANPRADHDLETLARESGYGRSHFVKVFRAATGRTPHAYLLELRVERATELLGDRSLRLADVAEMCGFRSQAQFSKVFRRLRGRAPQEQRRDRLF